MHLPLLTYFASDSLTVITCNDRYRRRTASAEQLPGRLVDRAGCRPASVVHWLKVSRCLNHHENTDWRITHLRFILSHPQARRTTQPISCILNTGTFFVFFLWDSKKHKGLRSKLRGAPDTYCSSSLPDETTRFLVTLRSLP